MTVNPEEFRRRFDQLSDDALLEINRDELVDVARDLYDAELAKRDLLPAEEESPESEPAEGESTDPKEELVLAAEFTSAQEAAFARSLLKSASIPFASKTNGADVLGTVEEELQVFVPASYLEQANELLATPLSDEDLAAQAEAAGSEEEPAEADEDSNEADDIKL